MPSGSNVSSLIMWCALPLACIGLLLLKFGWFPRRRGDEPRCRRCGYDLTANQSGQCPECGADVSKPKNVVHGVRRRRMVLAALGSFALLLAIVCLTPQARRAIASVDWYAWRPTNWVIADLRSTASPVDGLRAIVELERRRAENKLSDEQKRRIVESLLAALADGIAAVPNEFVEYLTRRANAGELTDEQLGRFFRGIIQLTLETRPSVAAGHPLPWKVSYKAHYPPGVVWSYTSWYPSISINGKRIDSRERGGMLQGLGNTGSEAPSATVPKDLKPGRHVLRLDYVFEIYRDATGDPSRLLYKLETPLEASFDVLPAGERTAVTQTPDPSLLSQMMSEIRVESITEGPPPQRHIRGRLHAGYVPADVAFDVFLRADGREYMVARFAWQKDRGYFTIGMKLPKPLDPPPERVDIILRSNPEVARWSVDITDIWQGELEFKDVPVTRKPAPPRNVE